MRVVLPPSIVELRYWPIPVDQYWFQEAEEFFRSKRHKVFMSVRQYKREERLFLDEVCGDWSMMYGADRGYDGEAEDSRLAFRSKMRAVLYRFKVGYIQDINNPGVMVARFFKSNNVKARTICDRPGMWSAACLRVKDNFPEWNPFSYTTIVVRQPHGRKDAYYYTPDYKFELKSVEEVQEYERCVSHANRNIIPYMDMREWGFFDVEEYAMERILQKRKGMNHFEVPVKIEKAH